MTPDELTALFAEAQARGEECRVLWMPAERRARVLGVHDDDRG